MKFYLKTKDYSVSQETFELFLDQELDMLVTKPEPQVLDSYYDSEVYISHTDANVSLMDKIYQTVKKINLKNKLKIVAKHAKGKRLLDVGAGTGDFLVVAKENGWSGVGVEPNKKARDKAFEKGLELKTVLEDFTDEKFDVITLWHVLEHVPNLTDQVTRLSALLSDHGILIVAVPNYKSFDAKYYKEHWAAFDVPRHLWHFSKSSITKLFSKEDLKISKIYPMVFDAYYVSLLSEKYKSGKQNFLTAFFVGLRSNMKAWRTKEYSSLIYVLKKPK
ncbi:bifunctional 2-polyprenyl-6-hydroxyphenol methylase/3-demethylubiquinol 3-O-methyltransferase UbiG [Cellulophaga sp. E6(2014)]|uniref:class I SAM-dependent methyltransferase n=1 Tax=Cellulophaga sp. E6(2014) TaxID=1495334 RepID=UPI00051D0A7E|nr:class I SAM-dependent methyltransferase [Cellulophaga sp. E6(2014)]KGK30489.1 methyltransferase [Cellulophaga sp. E6(2014)]